MGKVIKCTQCGSFYNGAAYNACPHCKNENQEVKEVEKPVENGKEKPFLPGRRKGGVTKPLFDFGGKTDKENEVIGGVPDPRDVLGEQREVLLKEESLKNEEDQGEKKQIPESKSEKPDSTSLKKEINKVGRTVAKFMSNSEEAMEPVVGWLVCVKGVYFGQSFNLKSGKNKIGRNAAFDVQLLNDDSVSRDCAAIIVFDSKGGEFSILQGDSDKLCYLDGKAVYERNVLHGYEEIEFGDSEQNKYIFVPLCGEKFSWNTYDKK